MSSMDDIVERLRRQSTMSPVPYPNSSPSQEKGPYVTQSYPRSNPSSSYSATATDPMQSLHQQLQQSHAQHQQNQQQQQQQGYGPEGARYSAPPSAAQTPAASTSGMPPPFGMPYAPPMGSSTSHEPTHQPGAGAASTPPLMQDPSANRSSLLELLKFSQPVQPSNPPTPHQAIASPPPPPTSINQPPHQPPVHNRAISAHDLVTSLFGPDRHARQESSNSPSHGAPPSQQPEQHEEQKQESSAGEPSGPSPVSAQQRTSPAREKSPVNAQDLVFQLLGRQKPGMDEPSADRPEMPQSAIPPEAHRSSASASPEAAPVRNPPSRTASNSSVRGNTGAESTVSSAGPSKGMFTYVNPFDQLAASSPRNRTPNRGPGTPHPGQRPLSGLGMREVKAESVPLPFTPPATAVPATPPAPVEASAAKEATSLDDVREKEKMLLRQLHEASSAEQTERQSPIPMPEPTIPEPETEPKEELPTYEESTEQAKEDDDSESEGPVEVYNFPMKPFSAITIVPSKIKRTRYPADRINEIARMNHNFDQLDRNLISATHDFIVYAKSSKSNGIRVIRTRDAKDKVLLKDSTDRTFNVTITRHNRVLGTGVSGAVVWSDLPTDFNNGNWDSLFVFPPSEEQGQSNGVLKSRARKSSRQKHVFAIGRGKSISIIYAPAAKAYSIGRKGNEVQSKKYLAEHARTIDTGKASKDFCFSDDDTIIISIDKAGKLKMWDVRELIDFSDEVYSVGQVYPPQQPMVLSEPLITFSAVSAGEPYRATSVMFLDKFRPYHKCLALRYVIVGMKQNHTLQLWDLALGRPVQEINFPQESETDALCSVTYHPYSGIIVVGNPTRNSIYFIHLSAPKYNLPDMSQAHYMRGLKEKDPNIPKPEATAILSGLREYSFPAKSQLISLDMLDLTEELIEQHEQSPALFELYVAHSKGMTALVVHKEDLGWEADNRVRNSVDAVVKGACTMSNMSPPPSRSERDRERHASPTESSLKPALRDSRSMSPGQVKDEVSERSTSVNGSVSSRKKRKDKAAKNASAANGEAKSDSQELSIGVSSSFLDKEVKRFEKTVNSEFTKVMNREMEQLYRRFDDDRRVQQAASDAKQDAILRLLSTTLTENVEQVIGRIVRHNIEQLVVPAVNDVVSAQVGRELGNSLSQSLSQTLPRELKSAIPDAVTNALTSPTMISRISDSLCPRLTQSVEHNFRQMLESAIIPTFQRLALDTAKNTIMETDRRQNETFAKLEQARREDSAKMEGLVGMMKTMSETIAGMAKAQQEFQDQVRRAQEEFTESSTVETPQLQQGPERMSVQYQKSPEELEAEDIEALLKAGKYEDGTIKWLQSKERQAELFDEVIVRYRYDFLPNLSQLVLLSVSAAVSVKFQLKVNERLSWLEGVLAVLDPMDPEIHEICHRIMVVVVQRLEQLYMNIAEKNPQDAALRKIPSIARKARELSAMCSP